MARYSLSPKVAPDGRDGSFRTAGLEPGAGTFLLENPLSDKLLRSARGSSLENPRSNCSPIGQVPTGSTGAFRDAGIWGS